jgi:hypothetical protein
MQITPQTKLSRVLMLHSDVLPYIISLSPHDFERLNNPLMRQLMPPRITLARLAAMVNKPVDEIIQGIYDAAHMELEDNKFVDDAPLNLPANSDEPPPWITDEVVAVVDLLESDERLDTDPFVPLFPALKQAAVGDVILLKHKWEPQPLYDVWQKLGVNHYAQQQSEDEWWIYLRKTRESYRK